MLKLTYFILQTLGRIGASIFSGTLVSCLILGQMEWLHISLMAFGLALLACNYPITQVEKTHYMAGSSPPSEAHKN